MSTTVYNFSHQYALLSVRGELHAERSVRAYPDELADRSREEAMANLNDCVPTRHASRTKWTASVEMVDRSLDQAAWTERLLRGGFALAKQRDFVYSLLLHSFATAIAFFYSKNLLSTAIRALISF